MCNDLLTDEDNRGIFPLETKEGAKWIEARGRWTQADSEDRSRRSNTAIKGSGCVSRTEHGPETI